MRTEWKDGANVRAVTVTALGDDRYRIDVDGAVIELRAERLEGGRLALESNGETTTAVITAAGARRFVRLGAMDFVLERAAAGRRKAQGADGGGLEAPMPGVVTKVLVAQGDRVQRGQPLVAVEAMKMEHMVRAPRDGQVKAVKVKQGELVGGGAALLELESEGP